MVSRNPTRFFDFSSLVSSMPRSRARAWHSSVVVVFDYGRLPALGLSRVLGRRTGCYLLNFGSKWPVALVRWRESLNFFISSSSHLSSRSDVYKLFSKGTTGRVGHCTYKTCCLQFWFNPYELCSTNTTATNQRKNEQYEQRRMSPSASDIVSAERKPDKNGKRAVLHEIQRSIRRQPIDGTHIQLPLSKYNGQQQMPNTLVKSRRSKR